MATATLVISSKNYSSWSLRGWLMTRMSGLDFEERTVPIDDPTNLTPRPGPYLFGRLSMADAMFASVVARCLTYDVPPDPVGAVYCQRIMTLPDMVEWVTAARAEPAALEDLDVEF
jgi:hypothetical protein